MLFYFRKVVDLWAKIGYNIINETEDKDKNQELTEDFISIVTSFCGRLYGANRKTKTKEIIETIKG